MDVVEKPVVAVPPVIGVGTLGYKAPGHYDVPGEWMNVEVFTLQAEALPRYLAAIVAINIGMWAAMIGLITAVVHKLQNPAMTGRELAIRAGIMGVVGVFLTFRSVRKAQRQWENYRLVVADQGLIHSDPPKAPMVVQREAVKRILEEREVFRLDLGMTFVKIPNRVERPERVLERLAQWQTIGAKQSRMAWVGTVVLGIVSPLVWIAATRIGMASSDVTLVTGCTVVSVVLAVVMGLRVWRSRTFSMWIKVGYAVVLAITLLLPVHLAMLIMNR